MTELNSEQVTEKINSGEKFLLDFYAPWCGPCRVLKGVLSNMEGELSVPVYTFNVDSDSTFTSKYGVRSVPTLKVFENGKVINSGSGVMNNVQIKNFVG
jgi:thioredoxin 1